MMGSDPLSLVLTAYLAMAVVMVGLWVLQLRVRNASIADVGWCAGLIAVVLMIISALLTSLTIAREWESGTMEQLLSTPVRAQELVLGKMGVAKGKCCE